MGEEGLEVAVILRPRVRRSENDRRRYAGFEGLGPS